MISVSYLNHFIPVDKLPSQMYKGHLMCYCFPSFRVPLPATAVLTVAARCGCVTVMDMWDRLENAVILLTNQRFNKDWFIPHCL